jgi:Reverse transcriptase (RNA-dependent DNA polymerase)
MVEDNPTRIKFRISVNNDQAEEIITYNKLLDYLANNLEVDIVWKFRRIISHNGPFQANHPEYKGSQYNLMIEWENGEITTEALAIIAADDPVTYAIYARDHRILDKHGWKRFNNIEKHKKQFTRQVNQAKLRSFNTADSYRYGYEVPRTYEHAMRLDQRNGNTI